MEVRFLCGGWRRVVCCLGYGRFRFDFIGREEGGFGWEVVLVLD